MACSWFTSSNSGGFFVLLGERSYDLDKRWLLTALLRLHTIWYLVALKEEMEQIENYLSGEPRSESVFTGKMETR